MLLGSGGVSVLLLLYGVVAVVDGVCVLMDIQCKRMFLVPYVFVLCPMLVPGCLRARKDGVAF